jgi:autophagy-related protein 9
MGLINAIFAPFIVLYLLMYSFFRYFEVSPLLYTITSS